MATHSGSLSNSSTNGKPRLLLAPHCNPKVRVRLSSAHSGGDSDSDSDGGHSGATFNHVPMVCLPLVFEDQKVVWTYSDQTQDLDRIPELVRAFNAFPYPTLNELTTLAVSSSKPLEKVKVWFMVQRMKYGISWTPEDIEQVRLKIGEQKGTSKYMQTNNNVVKTTAEEEEVIKVRRPPNGTPTFRSSLPPPEDSYYYREPANVPGIASAGSFPTLIKSESPSTPKCNPSSLVGPETPLALQQQQQRTGRYKKSKAQLALLRESFLRENRPSEAEMQRLQGETGLSRNDIRKWFSDSRYQLRHGRTGLLGGLSSPSLSANGGGGGGGGRVDLEVKTEPLTPKQMPKNTELLTHMQKPNNTQSHTHIQTPNKTGLPQAVEVKSEGEEHRCVPAQHTAKQDTRGDEDEKPLQLIRQPKAPTVLNEVLNEVLKTALKTEVTGKPMQLANETEPLVPKQTDNKTPQEQLQPLPLVARKPVSRGKPNMQVLREKSFFKNFLSERLQAFEVTSEMSTGLLEGEPAQPRAKQGAQDDEEEQPLQLIRQPSQPNAPTTLPTNTSSRSLSATPPPAAAALPNKGASASMKAPTVAKRKRHSDPGPGQEAPSTSTTSSLTAAGRPRKTKEQLDLLKSHFLTSQWPTSEEYTKLTELTGLPRPDVIQWFGDTRYAVKNGQLRWVRSLREQIVADITQHQSGGSGGGTGGSSRSRKRKQSGSDAGGKVPTVSSGDSTEVTPLESYYEVTGALREKDLDILCRKSRMSYQQVRDWFASKEKVSQPSGESQ
ncbi:homeobox and leucine zipper encoding a [Engraulis encrasicolus]|uniref:homeobox and leucine zipper encoding a n=1 Tax=Engraulis encrasicolus TaxID=184585 RepID=UPI002FD29A55